MEVPLNPVSKKEVHQLESVLFLATIFRPEILEIIKDPAEKLTWVDSLAVAAGAIAREKAKMSVSQIAEELGRTEMTIRKHLKGETKAGALVRETYNLLREGKLDEILKITEIFATREEYEKILDKYKSLEKNYVKLEEDLKRVEKEREELRREVESLKSEVEKRDEKIKELTKKFEELNNELEKSREKLKVLKEKLKNFEESLKSILELI